MRWLVAILLFLSATSAHAEYNWTWSVGCAESGTVSPAGTFTSTTTGGFTGQGTCERHTSGFTKFTLTSQTQTPNATTYYGQHTGDVLQVPPQLAWDRRPVLTLAPYCPLQNKSLNWIIAQWNQATRTTLNSVSVVGAATYSTSTGLTLDFGYDVAGTTTATGPLLFGGTACSSGVSTLSGPGDRGGALHFARSGAGIFYTNTQKRFFFTPVVTLNAATDFGSQTFKGYAYNSTDAAATRQVQMTADGAGTTWTIQAYSNVETSTLDGTYTDTVTISAVNAPSNGILRGSLTRTGTGAGSGEVTCIAGRGVGRRIICAVESPEDNTIPYTYVFNQEGPQIVGKSSGTTATDAVSFNAVEGVFIHGTRLFVADTSNNRVLIYNTIPTGNQVNPDVVLGQPDDQTNTANFGGRSAQSLSAPRNVWSDGTKVFVTDYGNRRVLIWNSMPTVNRQAADVVVGQTAFGNATNSTSSTITPGPYSAFSDGTKLYVTDYAANRVLIWNTVPTTNGVAANVVLGQPDMTSNTANNGGVTASSLSGPIGVVTTGTKLIVTDYANHRTLIWNTIPTTNQAAADLVLGQPDMTSNTSNNGGLSASSLRNPQGVYTNGTKLYIADRSNNRVLIWNTFPNANQAAANLVLGQTTLAAGGANAGGRSSSSLSGPRFVYGDSTYLFVADGGNHRVLQWNALPTANKEAATYEQGQPNMTSGVANSGGLSEQVVNAPNGVHTDGTRLFVADTTNNRVLIWNAIPRSNFTAADVVLGQPDMNSNTANNGGITSQSMNAPLGVFFDGTKLYVADTSNHRVLIWNTLPTTDQQAADVVLGQANMTSGSANPGGRSAQTFNTPEGVHVSGGKLFVADRANHRVLIWNTVPTVNQTAANVVLGQADMASAATSTTSQTFSNPRSVAASGANLYVADSSNNRVLVWNAIPTVNQTAADLVLGQADMTSAVTTPRTAQSLSGPYGVYAQGTQLFVSDTGNNRVLIWKTLPTSTQQAADAVFGQTLYTTNTANNGGLSSQVLSSPRQIVSDGEKVFIADSANKRVIAFPPP